MLGLLLLLFTKHTYLPSLFVDYIDVTQVIDNKFEDCFLYDIFEYEKEVPASRERFEKDFITIK